MTNLQKHFISWLRDIMQSMRQEQCIRTPDEMLAADDVDKSISSLEQKFEYEIPKENNDE